jgi:hypothetical protein
MNTKHQNAQLESEKRYIALVISEVFASHHLEARDRYLRLTPSAPFIRLAITTLPNDLHAG